MGSEREFWMTVRAALIMFVRAIEKRYNLGAWEKAAPAPMPEAAEQKGTSWTGGVSASS